MASPLTLDPSASKLDSKPSRDAEATPPSTPTDDLDSYTPTPIVKTFAAPSTTAQPPEPEDPLVPGQGMEAYGILALHVIESFENPPVTLHPFDHLVGDSGGQGFSLGLLGWSWSGGELQGLLGEMIERHRPVAELLLGSERLAHLESILAMSPHEAMIAVRDTIVRRGTDLFRDGWGEALQRLGNSQEFIRIQWRAASGEILHGHALRGLRQMSVSEMSRMLDRLHRVELEDEGDRDPASEELRALDQGPRALDPRLLATADATGERSARPGGDPLDLPSGRPRPASTGGGRR